MALLLVTLLQARRHLLLLLVLLLLVLLLVVVLLLLLMVVLLLLLVQLPYLLVAPPAKIGVASCPFPWYNGGSSRRCSTCGGVVVGGDGVALSCCRSARR